MHFGTKKRSTNIWEQLGIFNINDKLAQYKINWREHVQRMDNTNEMGRLFPGGRNKPSGLSLIVDDDDDDDDDNDDIVLNQLH